MGPWEPMQTLRRLTLVADLWATGEATVLALT
jgi:hypothetical protein